MIVLNKEQALIIEEVSKKTGISENMIIGGILEVGIMTIIGIRDKRMEKVESIMKKELTKDSEGVFEEIVKSYQKGK